jgi:hypothetical protein
MFATDQTLAVYCYVGNGGFFLRFLAKLEYFLKILINRERFFRKKSNTIDALVQKIQLDENGKFRYYVMFATMDMPI